MGFVAIGVLSLTIWQKIDIPLSFIENKNVSYQTKLLLSTQINYHIILQ